IKNTQKISKDEIELGLSDKSSWHSRFKHSAYIFAGGLPLNLTEGDLLAIFAQYGEIVDLRKPKGFAFLAYEDQRSTVVAVDNLSGAKVSGRTLRVEHVDNYRRKRAEASLILGVVRRTPRGQTQYGVGQKLRPLTPLHDSHLCQQTSPGQLEAACSVC
ncbi:hypothetical protein APUTEX25_003283, partial [Auxenochlorella protothecoides]